MIHNTPKKAQMIQNTPKMAQTYSYKMSTPIWSFVNCSQYSQQFLGTVELLLILPLLPGPLLSRVVVSAMISSMCQIDLFQRMFKMILNYINTSTLKTLIFQQNINCLPTVNFINTLALKTLILSLSQTGLVWFLCLMAY